MKEYQVLIHHRTWTRVNEYQKTLLSGASPGKHLNNQIQDVDLSSLSPAAFLEYLLRTKKPQIFAESEVLGDGSDWNQMELSILGDISFALPVTVYDNGLHSTPRVHQPPFSAHLIFTPGALLCNGYGLPPADWGEVVREGVIDRLAFSRLYERRLLPAFQFASDTAKNSGDKAFITIPGLGCGQFAGVFRGRLGSMLQDAILNVLENHGQYLTHLTAVYFDPYRECKNARYEIHGIDFMVRPLTQGNQHKPQLCRPKTYQEAGDDFSGCQLFSIVAWDHVSWPGNDFYCSARITDDGVKAAATDTMRRLTGIPGEYDSRRFQYRPPEPFPTWEDLVLIKGIQLEIKDNLILYPR